MDEESTGKAVAEALARLARHALEPVALARPFLDHWPALSATRPITPCRLPVVAHLGAPGHDDHGSSRYNVKNVIDSDKTRHDVIRKSVATRRHLTDLSTPALSVLVQTIVDRSDALEWRQTYTAADVAPAFLDGYGWSEFIGLRGPIPSTDIACGVLLLGPGIDYPPHAHEAEELYLPLAGSALWRRGEADFVLRPPGEPIHHGAWTPHAMRTLFEPLLALYVWRGGDLAAKSKFMGDATDPA